MKSPGTRGTRLRVLTSTGALLGAGLLFLGAAQAATDGDWPTYGHDPGGMRFSPLTQISPSNVAQLKPAWTYHLRPANAEAQTASAAELAQRAADGAGPPSRRRASRFSASQATPLVVDGVMYLSTPYRRVVALEPETGRELWAYDVPGPGQPSLRGVEYWPGDAKTAARIFFGTRDGRLVALDAKTGKPAAGFGTEGAIDMKTPDVMGAAQDGPPSPFAQYGMTSPPIVFRDLVITGSAVQEFPQLGATGDVRAWDARTGKLRWTFHTVPRPGEANHDSWEGDSWQRRSGVNAWGFLTVDAKRGIVYLPLGAPTWDRYGGDRHGANLYGTSIVALDATTGKYRWHFQVVHHDIWDFDTQAPPLLFDFGPRKQPAVAIVNKSGMLFVLDRVTGKPLIPVEERPVAASDVPGEKAWATQPFPVRPAPFARQVFSKADIATVTPELEQYCRNWIDSLGMRMGGPYLPVGYKLPTINFPGRLGGANWGGASFDPAHGVLYVNSMDFGHVEQLTPREDGSYSTAGPATGRFMEREQRLPCQQPPWGSLTAIDVNAGQILWHKPLGITDSLPADIAKTGRPNIGGSITTASGLVFVGATDDARFRAFDAKSGDELWTWKLEASAHATPITYRGRDGRQYVAVVATGGSFLDSPVDSDALTVFALP